MSRLRKPGALRRRRRTLTASTAAAALAGSLVFADTANANWQIPGTDVWVSDTKCTHGEAPNTNGKLQVDVCTRSFDTDDLFQVAPGGVDKRVQFFYVNIFNASSEKSYFISEVDTKNVTQPGLSRKFHVGQWVDPKQQLKVNHGGTLATDKMLGTVWYIGDDKKPYRWVDVGPISYH
ncbi:hypothetical protein AB5J55_43195 [Streptomyces sp. R11]|uniref:Secreted protein n=1 Tax=Streptomyces sp. R11 TaxID=3238625 RepID=A0AB39NEP4_9ACTN